MCHAEDRGGRREPPLETGEGEVGSWRDASSAANLMASALVHKVRSPLAGIVLAASRLRDALEDGPGTEPLRSIAESVFLAADTLSENLGRWIPGELDVPPDMKPVSVGQLCELGERVRKAPSAPGEPEFLLADPDRARRALHHVVEAILHGAAHPAGPALVRLDGQGTIEVSRRDAAPEPAWVRVREKDPEFLASQPGLRLAVASRMFASMAAFVDVAGDLSRARVSGLNPP